MFELGNLFNEKKQNNWTLANRPQFKLQMDNKYIKIE